MICHNLLYVIKPILIKKLGSDPPIINKTLLWTPVKQNYCLDNSISVMKFYGYLVFQGLDKCYILS